MSPEAFHRAAMALPAATMVVQWGGARVYKVGGKIFALMGGGGPLGGVSFKVSELAYEILVESGRAIPAPYLARARWVRLTDLSIQDEDEVRDWLRNAHALVSARLTRKVRAELGV